MLLQDKVAVVTGAASGLGKAIALEYLKEGATVIATDINAEKLNRLQQEYSDLGWLYTVVGDVSSKDDDEALINYVYEQFGKLDILVNNAVARTALARWDLPMADFDRSFHANASALFLLTRIAAETMKNHGGNIINIGSYMGICGLDHANYDGTGMQTDGEVWPSPAYHYEKGGMLNFTRWAASVLGRYNIRVNCVTLIGLEPLDGDRNQFHRQHAGRTLLNRCCGNEDLKGGIVYLASDASAFVTGSNLVIDGGYSAI